MTLQHKTRHGLNIFSVVDVSTSHITPGDNALLENLSLSTPNGGPYITVHRTERGFFIYVTCEPDCLEDDISNCREHGFSDAFIDLFRHAHESHATWLHLDGDGAISETLPTFSNEWF